MHYMINRIFSISFIFFIGLIHYEILGLFGFTSNIDSWWYRLGFGKILLFIGLYILLMVFFSVREARKSFRMRNHWMINIGSTKGMRLWNIPFIDLSICYFSIIGMLLFNENSIFVYILYLILPIILAIVFGFIFKRPKEIEYIIDDEISLQDYTMNNQIDIHKFAEINDLNINDNLYYAQKVFLPER